MSRFDFREALPCEMSSRMVNIVRALNLIALAAQSQGITLIAIAIERDAERDGCMTQQVMPKEWAGPIAASFFEDMATAHRSGICDPGRGGIR